MNRETNRVRRIASTLLAVGCFPGDFDPSPDSGEESGLTVENGHVQLDFTDVELSVVIDTIARLTGKNFIYDDRVRGRVTIVRRPRSLGRRPTRSSSPCCSQGLYHGQDARRRLEGHSDPRGQGKQYRDGAEQ